MQPIHNMVLLLPEYHRLEIMELDHLIDHEF